MDKQEFLKKVGNINAAWPGNSANEERIANNDQTTADEMRKFDPALAQAIDKVATTRKAVVEATREMGALVQKRLEP